MASWYAIAAMRHLGEPGSPPLGSRIVSQAAGVPFQFTRQMLQKLCRVGLVTAVRGADGGYTLGTLSDGFHQNGSRPHSAATTGLIEPNDRNRLQRIERSVLEI